MATYKQIQAFIKKKYNCSVKTCWIADLKEQYGLTTKKAPNRISEAKRVNPCPEKYKDKILDAFINFDMMIIGTK